ncbi:conserved hypothetical protein [Sphingomonas sp. EC-HK361]|uniref:cupin-like domain-containing protein n=1 Tax=Sphingomonas sp. EC-HK361 TaxID=2038397 RepID=UPI0012554B08|nr:cupin-like domain-containing protein [Sphingomonas sp. EC-HK361]VVT22038.1 conserved hypothetical protein [Sphingomonas sp. EC-HK361]
MIPANPIREIRYEGADAFAQAVADDPGPLVLRGLAADWPLVAAGRAGPEAAAAYLARFDRGSTARAMRAAPAERGRYFYTPDMRGFNFETAQVPMTVLIRQLILWLDRDDAPSLYAGSASTPEHLPGLAEANPMPLATPGATPRIWIGNASHISTHYDASENIAVVAAGRRRFTLFPPDQTPNLYVGPLDMTIAGQPVSMVDLRAPDLDRYPRFAKAMSAALSAELEPGDAIYIPTLWWHNVVAEGPFNILLNYWYGQPPSGSPFAALVHAMQAVRDLPHTEREAWRVWFDHYVFSKDAATRADHLPDHARGVMDAPSPTRTQRIVDYLVEALTRR